MPDWRMVLGIALIISGILILYVEISAELSRTNSHHFDYVPTQETVTTGAVIGGALFAAGAVLFVSGRKYLSFYARKSPGV